MIYSSHSSASEIYIGESPVGPGNPSYVIAEVGSNHNGNFDTARYLIDVPLNITLETHRVLTT